MTARSRTQPAAEEEEAGEPKATSSVAAGTAEKRKGESGDRNIGDARCSTSHLFPRSGLNGFAHQGFRKRYEAAPSIGLCLHRFPPGMMLTLQYLCPFSLERILSEFFKHGHVILLLLVTRYYLVGYMGLDSEWKSVAY